MKRLETVLTSKGTTTLPLTIRQKLGLVRGSRLVWQVRKELIEARPTRQERNAMQAHILDRAGSWSGYVSGEELLRRTRP